MNVSNPFHLSGRPVVIGTGLLALDVVLSGDDAWAPRLYAGGTCGNVLIILSYLGWKSYPVARLNGDTASKYVLEDLKKWGVELDWAMIKPGSNTPIVVQRIRRENDGEVSHRFAWTCPICGAWLPGYTAVHAGAAKGVLEVPKKHDVFFFDRVSRGAIILAKAFAQSGALVFFEPSSVSNRRLFEEAVGLAHILKYSYDRIHEVPGLSSSKGPLLEIQTVGSEGVRYRHRLTDSRLNEWINIPAPRCNTIRDTAGAGDWCSAGIIQSVGANGCAGLRSASEQQIVDALRFGQALAAWNCKFEGARGGMYSADKKSFQNNIREVLSGEDVIIADDQRPKRLGLNRLKCLSPFCREERAKGEIG